ncbi:hypothetical protein SAMN05443247_08149 [Bradyrhizobium erythrophlei]|jgi:hypothetical protein|nr:hypothetical protein SAMN05443247_08149 [Bradyrhizobium erythrophlei]
MTMRALVILAAVCFSAAAFAQSPSPKSAKKPPPLAHATPKEPMGCKLVGTVKGTKIWAGDCTDAAALRGNPTAETTPPGPGAIPTDQKQ